MAEHVVKPHIASGIVQMDAIQIRIQGSAFERDTAIELMIEEIKNFDMQIFIAFQRVVHDRPQRVIHLDSIEGIIEGELNI